MMTHNAFKIWHPFTQHKIFPDAIHIDRAEGTSFYTKDGRKIIDGISSWWINIHGHCHPKIVDAVQKQAAKLDQIIFAGFTHDPAEELAEKLVKRTGSDLQHVFFSDSGSTAVEVALKMAVGYWHNHGVPKRKIIALDNGYHGDTFGTMAAGARSVYNAAYNPFLFDVEHIALDHVVENFKKRIEEYGEDIAAFICEPLVQGAGGMVMYDAKTLREIYDLCKANDIIFIADEVMTGWGRTGSVFACDQAGFTPDILCSSKGLTGGYLPLAVTLCCRNIFDAFYSDDRAKTFFHSSSFTGNPLSCAAANASLDIWDEEPVQSRIDKLSSAQAVLLEQLSREYEIVNPRVTGTIAAFDIPTDSQGYLSDIGPKLYNFYLENEILLRPLGNTVYVLPPYCISMNELEYIYDTIKRSLDYIRNDCGQCAA